MRPPVDLPKTFRSFKFALQGIISLFRFENNARFHLIAAGAVVAAGFLVSLSTLEWAFIITQIGLVWAAEAVNTALEKLADAVAPGPHPLVGAAKDLAAGAVLIVSLAAVVVGILIFLPKLIALF